MAKIETWDLYTNHPSGDDGRRAVRSGYLGSLDEIPQIFSQQVTPGVWDFSQVNSPGASGSYAKSVLDDHNKRASLKPDGEGWTVTGFKEVEPAKAATKFHGGYQAGAAHMAQPARAAITVPIYSRIAPAPSPPPAPAPPPPPQLQVSPADEAAAKSKYTEAADRARAYLAQGPGYRGQKSAGSEVAPAQRPTAGSPAHGPEMGIWDVFARRRPGYRDQSSARGTRERFRGENEALRRVITSQRPNWKDSPTRDSLTRAPKGSGSYGDYPKMRLAGQTPSMALNLDHGYYEVAGIGQ